jgi:hypothetical protein
MKEMKIFQIIEVAALSSDLQFDIQRLAAEALKCSRFAFIRRSRMNSNSQVSEELDRLKTLTILLLNIQIPNPRASLFSAS